MQLDLNNEQTLFCYVTEDDLKDLNIYPEKLTYGSNAFRRLISLIMKKADEMYHFSADELPTMIEAVPLTNGEIFIQITLIEEAEELDPRFAQFAPNVFDELDDIGEDYVEDNNVSSTSHIPVSHVNRRAPKATTSGTVYTFTTYEALISAIKCGSNPESFSGAKSSLYYHPESKNYYLILKRGRINSDMKVLLASLCEYATARALTPTTNAWINEHCRPLIRSNAISDLLEQINV